MRFLPLIWSNLKRKKLRTGLTLLSILVAFILFGLLSSIKQALTGGVTLEGSSRLIVRHKVSIIQMLPYSYKARMERIPGVALATHQTWFGGKFAGDDKWFFMQSPVEPEDFLSMHPEIILAPEQKKEWLETRTGAIVGRTTADRFQWKVGQQVPITTSIYQKNGGNQVWEFELVGIFDGKDKFADTMSMFFRYDYFDEARPFGKGQVGWYTVRVKDPEKAAEIAQSIDREFENSAEETKTEPEAAFIQSWVKQIGNITLITASILGAVFFTILLVTANTMSQSVRERVGELGVLKAIGFAHQQVVWLVIAESCLLSLLGGGVGLGLACLIVPTVAKVPILARVLPMFFFPARDLVTGLAWCLGLGVVTGLFPAWSAMRLQVADALRRM
jgi:putative ABC transport system permease protein